MEKRLKSSRYISGIDGIRSLAVLGVIFYHLLPTSVRGGYLGVPVFFATSGYLITDLLRQEWQQNGKINLKEFFYRRFKRLYPALVTLLVVSTAYITLFQRNLLNNLRGIVTSSLFYVNNWWQINNELSYFDRFGNESPFTHLWSLAVEGQNYLIWPLLFIFLMRFVKDKKRIFLVISIGTLISAILMAILFTPGTDPTRVYYGTDTRIFSIWIGGGLAFIWPSTQLKEKIPTQAKRILDTAGIAALIVLILSFFFLADHNSFVYFGGMYLISLVAAILVAVTVHPGASLNRWLTNPVFTYLGKRSYGIYLYQFPVMIFYEAKVQNIGENVWVHVLIELALILIVTELSYRFIETPLRRFDYSKTWPTMKSWVQGPFLKLEKLPLAASALVSAIALVGFVIAPVNYVDQEQQDFQNQIQANREAAEKTQNNEGQSESQTAASEEELNLQEKYELTEQQVKDAAKIEFTAFGDSVMLGATINLKEVFPQAVVDAEVNRQMHASPDLLKELDNQDLLNDIVVLGLGTNGAFSEAAFRSVMETLGDRQIYLVNVRVPTQRWQNEVNQSLAAAAKENENVTLIDWYGYSNDHEEWFRDDRVHLNELGQVKYAAFIAENILNN